MSEKKKLSCIIVGAGHRSMVYARAFPEQIEVVGVADPSANRRESAAREFGLDPSRCFNCAADLAVQPKFADFVINGTMDHQHVETALPLLELGYDMLLEKPFATDEAEMRSLLDTVRKTGRKVVICHVLRHAPFYAEIRRQVAAGVIGDILNIQATEHVSYHHTVVGYVRGKWNRTDYCKSSMLMAKSCHDLDLITWMKSGIRPTRVSSFGSNFQFRPEKAPIGAGTRCVLDCDIETACLYSARKHYIDHPDRWAVYVWDSLEHLAAPSIEEKLESLKTSPYGRCVWKTDMDVVDHQSVLIEFEDGCSATLNMIGGCPESSRTIHLIGTLGEIRGRLDDNKFSIRLIDPRPGHEFKEEVVHIEMTDDMAEVLGGHGGGDSRLVRDFLNYLNEPNAWSATSIENSIAGHAIGFAANRSAAEGRVIVIDMHEWEK